MILILLGIACFYLILPMGIRTLMRLHFLAQMRRSGCICLTFDDGPSPDSTPMILQLLSEAGVRATFFVLGKNARKYPELITLIRSMGHEIGEHGFGHLHAWKANPVEYTTDLIRGGWTIRDYYPPPHVHYFRPPYGKFNLLTLFYAWLGRRKVIFWNVDPRDYEQKSAVQVAQHVIENLAPGRIVLLHDGRIRLDSNPAVTVMALKMILDAAGSRGIRFASLGEALSDQRQHQSAS